MGSLDTLQVISLLATLASLVLAVVAIWLSIVFFKMSSELAESTKEASKGIGSSVERLEKLFDKLYADTFSMMRDTVSDMRRHIWPEDATSIEELTAEADQKTEEKLADFRKQMEGRLGSVLSRQVAQDDRVQSLLELMDQAIESTREVASEAREETIREHVVRLLVGRRRVHFRELTEELPVSPMRLRRELKRLQREGLVAFDGDLLSNSASSEAMIQVNPRLRHLATEIHDLPRSRQRPSAKMAPNTATADGPAPPLRGSTDRDRGARHF